MIVLLPVGGLCNRMRAINSMHNIARVLHTRLIVFWQCNKESGMVCKSKDLFNLPRDIIIINLDYCDNNRVKRYISRSFMRILRKMCGKQLDDRTAYAMRAQGQEKVMDYFKSNVHESIFVETSCDIIHYAKVCIYKPKKDILLKVHELKELLSWDSSMVEGVHIRRTDNVISCNESPTECFVSAIEERIEKDPAIRFYVASDSDDEINALRRLFGEDKILSFIGDKGIRYTIEGERAAYIELLMLSSCCEILGSYWSSFSEMASYIGEITLLKQRTLNAHDLD